jgi:hypothetical protein
MPDTSVGVPDTSAGVPDASARVPDVSAGVPDAPAGMVDGARPPLDERAAGTHLGEAMPVTPRRPRAILGFSIKKRGDLLEGSKNIYNRMDAGGAIFASSPVTMTQLLDLITTFDGAQSAVRSRTAGTATARDAKAMPLISALGQLVAFVQSLADAANETDAISIIEAAGMKVAEVGSHAKAALEVDALSSGAIRARANVGLLTKAAAPTAKAKQVCLHWQITLDEGKSFIRKDSTPVGEATWSGFTAKAEVGVQVAVTVGKLPMGAWSQTVYVAVK